MVTVRQKTVTEMNLAGVGETHARTTVKVRDVASTIDEPLARGGTNEGLTPTETLFASLIGCTNVITQRIAHHMGVAIEGMTVDASVAFDRRGVSLEEEIEVPFQSVALRIAFRTDATAEQIEAIKRDLAKFCPVAKVIRNAGTPINETWDVLPL